ncbi:hypothetical protein COLO4_02413 [Corchorus olitorius]|uniref:Uncharacterized protein n=1 Tax=Corchorus olitorius TaxID=93759 RepID=A0A1R3L117_9ROSI|nr:hypothetical protein COLO4_02413 [Corchorus olitorius]
MSPHEQHCGKSGASRRWHGKHTPSGTKRRRCPADRRRRDECYLRHLAAGSRARLVD